MNRSPITHTESEKKNQTNWFTNHGRWIVCCGFVNCADKIASEEISLHLMESKIVILPTRRIEQPHRQRDYHSFAPGVQSGAKCSPGDSTHVIIDYYPLYSIGALGNSRGSRQIWGENQQGNQLSSAGFTAMPNQRSCCQHQGLNTIYSLVVAADVMHIANTPTPG